MRFAKPARWTWFAIVFMAIVGPGFMLLVMDPPSSDRLLRLQAQERWAVRPFTNYRITVEVWQLNQAPCIQELTIQKPYIGVEQNTCGLAWLPLMTVERLFAYAQELETVDPCHASQQGPDCACQVEVHGQVAYDQRWGYPDGLELRYTARPALHHPDYWQRFLAMGAQPRCSPVPQERRAVVVSLVPLP